MYLNIIVCNKKSIISSDKSRMNNLIDLIKEVFILKLEYKLK